MAERSSVDVLEHEHAAGPAEQVVEVDDVRRPSCWSSTLADWPLHDERVFRKSVSIAATSLITGAASSSSVEAPEHLTTSVVTETSTFPPGDVSASEDKMPKDLPMTSLTTSSGAALPKATQDEVLTQILELEKKHHDHIVTFVERSKQNSALLKQSNQLLARAESAEAKSAEEQERYAKQEKDHLAAIAVLQEQVDSLKEKNKKLSASLKDRVQAEATIKEELTYSKNVHEHTQHQLDQALQRGKTLKDQLELERKMCQDAVSQLDADRKGIRDLSTRLEKSIEEKEEIKAAATSILQLVSGLSENEVSKTFLEQVPGLIQVYCKKAARVFASQALGSVRALFPSLDLTPVGEGVPEDCSTKDLDGHIAAMESVAERLLRNENVLERAFQTPSGELANRPPGEQ